VHAWDNVIVADSSVFVTASGYGPTLTLVALAARAAHHLAGTKPAGPVGGNAPGDADVATDAGDAAATT
jgi:choline dehydrogenase-like flavoprotein